MSKTRVISKVFCYLSPVGKGIEPFPSNEIRSFEIVSSDQMWTKLEDVIKHIDKTCEIDMKFISDGSKQKNETRDEIINLMREKTLEKGIPLIERLSKNTDKSCKIGLVFIVLGKNDRKDFILIARYPSEEGIVLKRTNQVEVVKNVFLKNSHRYKLAFFEDESLQGGFWKGKAVDKQINDSANLKLISNYWIKDFLNCELELTEAQGNKLLGRALRKILNDETTTETDKDIINSIASAAKLLNGKTKSINSFLTNLSISDDNRNRIIGALPSQAVAEQMFKFNSEIINGEYNLKALYLSNGGIVMAPTDSFDKVFTTETVDTETGEVSITTEGIIQKQTIRVK